MLAPPGSPRVSPSRRRAGFQPHVQALRALAVTLVLVYHLWPSRLTGGFVGVDVFFVISGYLITAQLVREAISTDHVSLSRFWARRARRLLPASLLVAAVSAVGVVLWVPTILWRQFLREVAAGTLYVENWALAQDAVDYLAKDNVPAPVQHYWSLSVEEQFYLVWPFLVVLALLIARRLRPGASSRLTGIAAIFGLVGVASFVWSVVETSHNPGWAYFSTLTRAWEFAVGGLLAVLHAAFARRPDRRPLGAPALATAAAYLGLALIVIAAMQYDDQTPFPSWRALLPVAGALVMLAAGSPRYAASPSTAYNLRPVQWLGDVSYSVYLWHFPLIVLLPHVTGHPLSTTDKVAIGVATLVLAGLTKVLVEDPVRTSTLLSERLRPRATYVLTAATTAAVLAVSLAPLQHVERETVEAVKLESAIRSGTVEHVCFGAAARLDPSCADSPQPETFVPTLLTVANDDNHPCDKAPADEAPLRCELGTPAGQASTSVALVGNSHGMQLRGFLSVAAERRDWHVYDFSIVGCAASFAVQKSLRGDDIDRCMDHNQAVVDWLHEHPEVTHLIVNNSTSPYAPAGGRSGTETAVHGYLDYWEALPVSVEHVVVVRDHPQMAKDFLTCLSESDGTASQAAQDCRIPRRTALRGDTAVTAAERFGAGARVVDLTDAYCDREFCYPVIGGVLVYRNFGHVTGIWQESLAPFVARRLDKVLGTAGTAGAATPAASAAQ